MTFHKQQQQSTVVGKLYRCTPVLFCFVVVWTGSQWRSGIDKPATPVVRSKAGGERTAGSTSSGTATASTSSSTSSAQRSFLALPDFAPAHAKYKDCQISWQPPPPKTTWTTKPLWLAGFHGSGTGGPNGKGDILKPMINGITGLAAGAKFYHASSKILKRCKGRDETATCTNGHPVVPIAPEKQTANFNRNALVCIRNYRTIFPTSHNDKAEAYHDAKGIVPENDWRQFRDEWYQAVLDGWKLLIMTWKELKEYDVAMYVQYEAMLDPNRGPIHAQRLADALKASGFNTAPNEDIPCIWYRSVKDERARIDEYFQYIPGYTQAQKDAILKHIDTWRQDVQDDKELVDILTEYYNDVKENTRIDIPWVNNTKA